MILFFSLEMGDSIDPDGVTLQVICIEFFYSRNTEQIFISTIM